MKAIAAVIMFFAATTVANSAAMFCMNVTPSGGSMLESCWAIPDAALGDLVETFSSKLVPGGIEVSPTKVAEDGTVTPRVVRSANPEEVFAALAARIKDDILRDVTGYKKAKAAAAAAAAVEEINATLR